MNAALAIDALGVELAGRCVLEAVSLRVAPGEVVGVLGRNGAGKTTLLRAALGLVRPNAGRVTLGGLDLGAVSERKRASLAAYLPQERRIAWDLPAWRVAALGAIDRPPAAARAAAIQALERVGLGALQSRGALSLSGGERARALLARFLVAAAPLMVADEPIAGLDIEAQLMALDLLREEASAGRGVLVSLHDLALAARSCDRIVVLRRGRIVAEGAPAAVLSPRLLREAFAIDGDLTPTDRGPVLSASRAS